MQTYTGNQNSPFIIFSKKDLEQWLNKNIKTNEPLLVTNKGIVSDFTNQILLKATSLNEQTEYISGAMDFMKGLFTGFFKENK